MSATRQELEKIKGLIDAPEKWCQGRSRSGSGARRCAFQAVVDVLGERAVTTKAYRSLVKVAGMGVGQFNDTHDHDELMALFDGAIAAA